MSVPLSERGISKKKYYDYALKLDDKIVGLLIRDFGLKTICKDLNVFTHKAKMNELDKSLFNKLCEVYHLNVEAAYPYWLIDHYYSLFGGETKWTKGVKQSSRKSVILNAS